MSKYKITLVTDALLFHKGDLIVEESGVLHLFTYNIPEGGTVYSMGTKLENNQWIASNRWKYITEMDDDEN